MRFKAATIHGFGKLVDRSFTFGPGMNIVVGANESGKTTLGKCLFYLLYPMQSRRNCLISFDPESIRYRPWNDGARYSAETELIIEGRQETLIVTRDYTLDSILVGDSADKRVTKEGPLGLTYLGIPKDIFRNLLYVSDDNLLKFNDRGGLRTFLSEFIAQIFQADRQPIDRLRLCLDAMETDDKKTDGYRYWSMKISALEREYGTVEREYSELLRCRDDLGRTKTSIDDRNRELENLEQKTRLLRVRNYREALVAYYRLDEKRRILLSFFPGTVVMSTLADDHYQRYRQYRGRLDHLGQKLDFEREQKTEIDRELEIIRRDISVFPVEIAEPEQLLGEIRREEQEIRKEESRLNGLISTLKSRQVVKDGLEAEIAVLKSRMKNYLDVDEVDDDDIKAIWSLKERYVVLENDRIGIMKKLEGLRSDAERSERQFIEHFCRAFPLRKYGWITREEQREILIDLERHKLNQDEIARLERQLATEVEQLGCCRGELKEIAGQLGQFDEVGTLGQADLDHFKEREEKKQAIQLELKSIHGRIALIDKEIVRDTERRADLVKNLEMWDDIDKLDEASSRCANDWQNYQLLIQRFGEQIDEIELLRERQGLLQTRLLGYNQKFCHVDRDSFQKMCNTYEQTLFEKIRQREERKIGLTQIERKRKVNRILSGMLLSSIGISTAIFIVFIFLYYILKDLIFVILGGGAGVFGFLFIVGKVFIDREMSRIGDNLGLSSKSYTSRLDQLTSLTRLIAKLISETGCVDVGQLKQCYNDFLTLTHELRSIEERIIELVINETKNKSRSENLSAKLGVYFDELSERGFQQFTITIRNDRRLLQELDRLDQQQRSNMEKVVNDRERMVVFKAELKSLIETLDFDKGQLGVAEYPYPDYFLLLEERFNRINLLRTTEADLIEKCLRTNQRIEVFKSELADFHGKQAVIEGRFLELCRKLGEGEGDLRNRIKKAMDQRALCTKANEAADQAFTVYLTLHREIEIATIREIEIGETANYLKWQVIFRTGNVKLEMDLGETIASFERRIEEFQHLQRNLGAKEREVSSLDSETIGLQGEIDKAGTRFEVLARELLARLGQQYKGQDQFMNMLSTAYKRTEGIIALTGKRRLLDQQLKACETTIAELSRQIQTIEGELNQFLHDLGVPAGAENLPIAPSERWEILAQIRHIEEMMARLLVQRPLGEVEQEFARLIKDVQPLVLLDQVEKDANLPTISDRMKTIKNEINSLREQWVQLLYEMREREIAQKVYPNEIKEDLSYAELRLEEAMLKRDVLVLALSKLEQAYHHLTERFQDTIRGFAKPYLKRLIEGAYTELSVDGHFNLNVIDDRGKQIPIDSLSQGTRDQLIFALRLACIHLFRKADGQRPPLLFDEPFGSYDENRLHRSLDILASLASDFQIFYFTSHPEHVRYLNSVADKRTKRIAL